MTLRVVIFFAAALLLLAVILMWDRLRVTSSQCTPVLMSIISVTV